jgi:hypothetical protein
MYQNFARAILGNYQGTDYEEKVDLIASSLATCLQPLQDRIAELEMKVGALEASNAPAKS